MQLISQKPFTVVRQISDHTDSATYYVKAVIRNAFTDEIIVSLNLDDKGSQRFKKDWIPPLNPKQESYYVSIVTSVYSDSGYTTKSPTYGDEENTYQVAAKESIGNVGGGGGYSISRSDIREIISDELDKRKPEKITIPKQEKIDLSEIIKVIKIVENKIKKPEKVELMPIKTAIDALKSAIEAIKIPNLDLSSVLKKIDDMDEINNVSKDDIQLLIKESTVVLVKRFDKKLNEFIEKIESFLIEKEGEQKKIEVEKGEKEKPLDISKLST